MTEYLEHYGGMSSVLYRSTMRGRGIEEGCRSVKGGVKDGGSFNEGLKKEAEGRAGKAW